MTTMIILILSDKYNVELYDEAVLRIWRKTNNVHYLQSYGGWLLFSKGLLLI